MSRRENENFVKWSVSPTYPSPGGVRASPLLGASHKQCQSCMLTHTPLLCKWGPTGPLHISSKLLRPWICAAYSEYITSANAAPQQSLLDATQIFFTKWCMTRFSESTVWTECIYKTTC